MAIKKCLTVRLRVIYDSQATNRKQGGLLPPPPTELLLVVWGSYMTPSWPGYTKTPPQRGGNFYFLIEKSYKIAFFY
jgi:hypothetical protein